MTQNNETVKPLFDYVHIRKPRPEMTTESGIVLPEEQRQSKYQGTVLAIGPQVKMVKVGDVIIYKQYSSNAVPNTDGEFLVKEEDVLAIIKQ